MKRRVCVVEGDDAAPEAVRPTVKLLTGMELDVEYVRPVTGIEAIERFGSGFPEEARKAVDAADCTLFGATSGKTGGLAYLRWGKGTYANVRPVRWCPGFASPLRQPEGIDYIIVRENLEGLYPAREGDLEQLAPLGISDRFTGQQLSDLRGKFAIRVITEANSRQIAVYACELARMRKAEGYPGKVTCVAKYNMLGQSCGLFRSIVRETVSEYHDLTYEEFIVDDFARRIVMSPYSLDVVVTTNLFGDILADEAAGTIGGLGLAPSACIGDSYAYFEPVHGTAPDIAGRNIINPTATILSACLMLDYLGMKKDSAKLRHAVESVYRAGSVLTPDQGGTSTTTEFCEEVTRNLDAQR